MQAKCWICNKLQRAYQQTSRSSRTSLTSTWLYQSTFEINKSREVRLVYWRELCSLQLTFTLSCMLTIRWPVFSLLADMPPASAFDCLYRKTQNSKVSRCTAQAVLYATVKATMTLFRWLLCTVKEHKSAVPACWCIIKFSSTVMIDHQQYCMRCMICLKLQALHNDAA